MSDPGDDRPRSAPPPAAEEGGPVLARRKLLQLSHYVAPAILATLVVDSRMLAPGSHCNPSLCGPMKCRPGR